MPRKFFRKYLPHADTVRSSRLAALFGQWLQEPNLWHLNRRSVAGGVAIGLFCGLIPGPLQMLVALALAVPLRKNVPVALLMTFYTNPLTIVPLYWIAFEYGQLLLGATAQGRAQFEPFEWNWWDIAGSLRGFVQWALALGKPLAVGLLALALTLAALGYVGVKFFWRVHVVSAWRARARRRRR
ncbi:MAG TPA: DUF2062 domain-containing protein [Burkholderiales bacterium]|nr:DUF2062 domain-containing protein [Burkholderiales bacterium]